MPGELAKPQNFPNDVMPMMLYIQYGFSRMVYVEIDVMLFNSDYLMIQYAMSTLMPFSCSLRHLQLITVLRRWRNGLKIIFATFAT